MHRKQFIAIVLFWHRVSALLWLRMLSLQQPHPTWWQWRAIQANLYAQCQAAQEFRPPPSRGFYILAGPSTSSSSSVQIINGQMTQTYEYSYTYILEATAEGKMTIDPATVTVSKKEYKTQPVTIEVVRSGAAGQQQSRQQRQPVSAGTQAGSDEDIFVAIEYDRQTAYRGQPILATVKIYTRQNISGFDEVKFPSFNGFWSQDLETPSHVEFQRVNINGKIYNSGVLKKYLLFAQRTGDVPVDPFEIVILMQQRGGRPQSMFDEFFGTYQTVRRRLVSKPTVLKIRDLPPNAPYHLPEPWALQSGGIAG